MNTQIDRKKIAADISAAAKLYKQNLIGKTFLYIFDGQYIEVMFKTKDFKHLTGVDTNLPAQEFYKLALKNQLQAKQIYFSSRHPYSLAQRKLAHLSDISGLAMGESFILKDISTQTETYKFGTTDLKFTVCFNKETDETGADKGSCFIAKSLRDEDCFSRSKDVHIISHIFMKQNDEKKYKCELYHEKNTSICDFPENIRELLSPELTENI